MILTNNTSSHVGRLACLLILAIGLTVLPFSVQARARDDSSSDLEKRITRLEKLVDNLRKALVQDTSVDADASSVPRHTQMVHQNRAFPPPGVEKKTQAEMLDALKQLNQQRLDSTLETRIKHYEMAFRVQAKVTELQKKASDLKAELRSIEKQIKELVKPVKDSVRLFLPGIGDAK